MVTEVMNMVENCWFNESNMLCEARGGLEKRILKGENQITQLLITDICFHFTYNHTAIGYAILSAVTFCEAFRYII